MEQLTFENIETDNKPRIVDLNYKIKVACINTDVDWLIPISQLDEKLFTQEHWNALTRAIQKYIEDYSKQLSSAQSPVRDSWTGDFFAPVACA